MRSARYAGEDASDEQNLDKLLREVPAGESLRYVCALAYVDPVDAGADVLRRAAAGRLAELRAATGGFGYDPAFVPDDDGDGRTMAELERRREGRDQPPGPRGPGAAGDGSGA